MTELRVVLAEDDVLLREGMASLLERSGIEVVGQAGDGAQLLPLVHEKKPDLVVVDRPTTTTAASSRWSRFSRLADRGAGFVVTAGG